MSFEELKLYIKRLYLEYIRFHIKKILIALVLSIIVAGTTSGIAWLLDPAVKKIFIDHVESRIESIYQNLIIDTSKTKLLKLKIQGINSFEEYELLKEKLSKFISVSKMKILNFNNKSITYEISVMGDINTFKNTIETSTFFEVVQDTNENILHLRFIK